MVPSAILSYLGLKSIDQNAENLRTKYGGTINLVRDKLESEVIQLEENLRNSLIELFPKLDRNVELKEWIRNIESENPAFKHLFLLNADGGLISTSVSLEWEKWRKSQSFRNPQTAANFNMAEKAASSPRIKEDLLTTPDGPRTEKIWHTRGLTGQTLTQPRSEWQD